MEKSVYVPLLIPLSPPHTTKSWPNWSAIRMSNTKLKTNCKIKSNNKNETKRDQKESGFRPD